MRDWAACDGSGLISLSGLALVPGLLKSSLLGLFLHLPLLFGSAARISPGRLHLKAV